MTPFKSLSGLPPLALPEYVPGLASVPILALDLNLHQRKDISDSLKGNLHKSRQQMVDQANKH